MASVATIMTVLACVLHVRCENIRLQLGIMDRAYTADMTLYTSGKILHVIYTTAILLMQQYPFTIGLRVYMYNDSIEDVIYYHVNDFLHILSFFRLAIDIAKLFNLSSWISNSSHRIWYMIFSCSTMYGCDSSTFFAVKCLMKSSPLKLIISLGTLTIIMFATLLRICEEPIDRYPNKTQRHNFANCLYEVFLTMSTGRLYHILVGFGDVYPRTIFGRLSMVACALNGVFIVSMMVLSIINTFVFDTLESRTYIVTSKVLQKKSMKQISESIVSQLAALSIRKSKSQAPTVKHLLELKQKSREFQKLSQ